MEREIGKNIPQGDRRISFLKDNCEKVEQKGYMKRFTSEQLAQMKEQLSEVAIKIDDVETEKKVVMDGFKEQLKPLNEERATILQGLRNKAEHVTELCYKFVDLENREVGYYNEDGDLIESRPAYADELQINMFQTKTGTND